MGFYNYKVENVLFDLNGIKELAQLCKPRKGQGSHVERGFMTTVSSTFRSRTGCDLRNSACVAMERLWWELCLLLAEKKCCRTISSYNSCMPVLVITASWKLPQLPIKGIQMQETFSFNACQQMWQQLFVPLPTISSCRFLNAALRKLAAIPFIHSSMTRHQGPGSVYAWIWSCFSHYCELHSSNQCEDLHTVLWHAQTVLQCALYPTTSRRKFSGAALFSITKCLLSTMHAHTEHD